MQVECGDGNGPIKFMIQKAGSTDNTLGFNGWQSADHWFTANLDPQSNIEVGELVWVKLEASIIRHLSFTNYRISAKRDGGKACAGVLSGGVISDRPDGTKKSGASLVVPTSLSSELPDLPEAFSKTQINVKKIFFGATQNEYLNICFSKNHTKLILKYDSIFIKYLLSANNKIIIIV
jgi:hypothetical protein